MYPRPIPIYEAPLSVAEALALLARHGTNAAILAGGQGLLQDLKARRRAPAALIDINRIRDLDSVRCTDARWRLGALLRLASAANHPELRREARALTEAASAVGDRQVRNRATVVGNIAARAHYGDIAPAAAALDARLEVCATDGTTREIPVERYASSPVAPDGLLTALVMPVAPARSGSAYLKHGRVAQDRATVGVAAWLVRGTDGRCAAVRLAVGGLEAAPVVRASAVEAEASGAVIDDALLGRLARLAATTLPTQDDELASAEYRRQLLSVYLPRALATAWLRSTEDGA